MTLTLTVHAPTREQLDAGYAAALGKALVTLHPPEHDHALKEVDRNPSLAQNGDAGSNPLVVKVTAQQFAWSFEYRVPILGNLGVSVFYDLAKAPATWVGPACTICPRVDCAYRATPPAGPAPSWPAGPPGHPGSAVPGVSTRPPTRRSRPGSHGQPR